MASFFTVEDKEATLSATFRSFSDVFSPSFATIDVDIINFSSSAISKRANIQEFWSVFDGATKMVSIFTKGYEEEKTNLTSVRDIPRCPSPSYLSKILGNHDNAILGYATNCVAKILYYLEEFPPPLLTVDVVFIPAPENAKPEDFVTLIIIDPSLSLTKVTWSFSHRYLGEGRVVMKKEKEKTHWSRTLFIFVKFKEVVEWVRTAGGASATEKIYSSSEQEFKVDVKFAEKIQALYGNLVPDELLAFVSLISYEQLDALSFETYLESGSIKSLMTEVILGSLTYVFKPKQIEKICELIGYKINAITNEGLGSIVRLLRHNTFLPNKEAFRY